MVREIAAVVIGLIECVTHELSVANARQLKINQFTQSKAPIHNLAKKQQMLQIKASARESTNNDFLMILINIYFNGVYQATGNRYVS